MVEPAGSQLILGQRNLLEVPWAPRRETECGKWPEITGLRGDSRKSDFLGLGREWQNIPSCDISEEDTL